MHPKNLRIQDYSYSLPEEQIAKFPLTDREAARLLHYNAGTFTDTTFRQLPDLIPSGSLLVMNETKVIPARILFHKPTGGTIEIFCLEPHERYANIEQAMDARNTAWWHCLVGGAGKWKSGAILSQTFNARDLTLNAVMAAHKEGVYTIQFYWNNAELTFAQVLEIAGKVPLPPYLRREAQATDKVDYQTVYASREGSVAAPTAGLHITQNLLDQLARKGVEHAFLTLHVGAGTFKPVKAEIMAGHEMHAEWIEVDHALIDKLIRHKGQTIAVGTTSMRTLESLYWIGALLAQGQQPDLAGIAVSQWLPYEAGATIDKSRALQALADHLTQTSVERIVTRTQIMIAPGYSFQMVDGLITNFHQPASTLLLLVAALLGEDWRQVYAYAQANGFRFLSYGDGSLLWRHDLHTSPA